MEEYAGTRYWCHMCSRTVNVTNVEQQPQCPLCQSGFVEAMDTTRTLDEFTSDHALSLWAPIFLNVMGNTHNRRRFRRGFLIENEDADDDDNDNDDNNQDGGNNDRPSSHHEEVDQDSEMDREIDSIIHRRRTSPTILQLLQGIRAGLMVAAESHDNRMRDRDHLLLINPFNHQTIGVQGGGGGLGESLQDPNQDRALTQNLNPLGSLSDYLIGPGLDLLLQHLSENDPNRYGTPPTQKDVIESLPVVRVEKSSECSICLDDCEVGTEVTQMPCNHKFHTGCLRPWLELHSSCPVCRFQLPSDESKHDSQVMSSSNNNNNSIITVHENGNNNEIGRGGSREELGTPRERRLNLPWSLGTLFSSAMSQVNTNGSSSSLQQSTFSSSSSGAAAAAATPPNPPPPPTQSNGN